jgi:hypothetical protein
VFRDSCLVIRHEENSVTVSVIRAREIKTNQKVTKRKTNQAFGSSFQP